ncbi:MAG: vitamin K epoxide reductase family protein [Microgenomates group bacterium]
MTKVLRVLPYLIIVLALAGVIDASYLTYEHYARIVPPCSIHWWLTDCGRVLNSSYSIFLGIVPLALLGVFQYTAELLLSIYIFMTNSALTKKLLLLLSTMGLLFSAHFVYLMIFVIHAICLYCFASAIISLFLFILSLIFCTGLKNRFA